ncbi:hypothetical protein CVO77_10345 [Sphingopyxis lindanitolerans]|uniref:Integron n=1 Tax=Sphingopyxis lindanitolerans TaxID=2054227 RepID=A0A2S8B8Z4_9SPHN|nr:hypothetical protein [Sphingopyxis lindanitolerans]PQM28810.1 hypothetical protein CVO77_10345 [Sphingopyxis lindanitolerans]
MKHRLRAPVAVLLALSLAPSLAACSQPAPPADNAPAVAGEPIATRAVMIGTEGASLPACSSISRVKAGGTDVYWAPGETRAVKAKLAGAMKVSVCEATDDDAWFGIVFAGPGIDEDMCGVGRSVQNAREYQGPCRWGWIRGGTVQLGA